MYRLLVNLYEFGQFLRILLWISVPLVILSMLITTWLHYRRKRQVPEELLLSLSGAKGGETGHEDTAPTVASAILRSASEPGGNGNTPMQETGVEPALDPEQQEKVYKGILWMKQKYEQYRDMADRRYEQLKEQLTRTEKKYQELLEAASRNLAPASQLGGDGGQGVAAAEPAGNLALSDVEKASYPDLLEEKNRQIAFLQQQLDQRIKTYHQAEIDGRENKSRMLELEEGLFRTRHLLEEKQAYIDQLEGQLVSERRKIEDLVSKLQTSSHQLLTIYEELDRSMRPAADEPLNSPTGS
ncbi:MAG TPA: hypothetical protein VHE34_15965 [Puia sp.]|uniref:hypothetical protein n=1 Tax=Puia sp. TaxID=2045100 RepID=UPI002CEFF97B|nr:hypothetical protein [Puia sp.]HVU96726.1 hypothetical protein [Puia sp.]